jgi:multidrug efflux pump
MGEAIEWFKSTADQQLPQEYRYDFTGEARQLISEGQVLTVAFFMALLVIYLVLAMQFESLRDPLVILVSVPMALSGALIALAWGAATLNIYSQIGLITLVGLISKHGILITEVAKTAQLEQGLDRQAAVLLAAKLRLRPIVMTTAAMVAGSIPLLYATGAGAAARFSLGLVMVAGLSLGTLFTLFILPVFYTLLASQHRPLPQFIEESGLIGRSPHD